MDEPHRESETSKEARAAEAAAIRRRWITLGETLAVLAVLISALTLWLNWSERSSDQADRAVQSAHEAKRAATLTLVALPAAKGARLDARTASPDQAVQGQTLHFPTALGVSPVETTGDSRIEAGWFDGALKRARGAAGLPDDSRGDERMPVLIATHFIVDGKPQDDLALYDIGYTVSGQLLGGHQVTLRGLSLVRRVKGEGAVAVLDARWRMPERKDR